MRIFTKHGSHSISFECMTKEPHIPKTFKHNMLLVNRFFLETSENMFWNTLVYLLGRLTTSGFKQLYG